MDERFSSVNIPEYIRDLSRELEIEGVHGLLGNEMELIALIRHCPFLYDRSYRAFKDAEKKNQAWEAIAQVFNVTVFEIEEYWKSMREAFGRYRNKLSEQEAKTSYPYFDEMKFLLPFIHRRNRSSSSTAVFRPKEDSVSSPSSEPENGTVDTGLKLDVLISEVKKNPILYDRSHKEAKNHDLKLKTWKKVAKELGISVSECVSRWKRLRERYARERKWMKNNPGVKQWYLFEELSFLEEHVLSRRRISHTRVQNKKSKGIFNLKSPDAFHDYNQDSPSHSFMNELRYDQMASEGTDQDIEYITMDGVSNNCENAERKASSSSNYGEDSVKDEDELFALAVTAELKKIKNPRRKMKLKAEIYRLLGASSCNSGNA